MSVPFIFSNVPGGTTIPLSELDANFAYLTNNPIVGNMSVAGSLTVNGSALFSSNVSANGLLTLANGLRLSGPLTIGPNTVTPTGIIGTGQIVLNTSPAFVTPNIGTPSSGTLTNCLGLPIAGVVGINPLAYAFLASPTSLNLQNMITDETGTGNLVFSNGPTLVAPVLGTPASGNLTNCTGYSISNLVGTPLPINLGGTSAATATQAINNLLPTQTTQSGKYLSTDGTNPSWEDIPPAVTSITLDPASTGLTVNGSPTPATITTVGTFTLGGILNILNGGTGAGTQQKAINNLAGNTKSGYYLRGNGTNVVMSQIQLADITALGTLSNNTTGSAASISTTNSNPQFNSVGVGVAASGTAGNVTASGFYTDGTGTLHPLVRGTAVIASGTANTFTGIPSWATRVTIMLYAIQTSGTSFKQVQVGTSTGLINSGYLGFSSQFAGGGIQLSTGAAIYSNLSTDVIHGSMVFNLQNAVNNCWSFTGNLADSNNTYLWVVAGSIVLPSVLTQISLGTVNGTDTFTAGTVNILYE